MLLSQNLIPCSLTFCSFNPYLLFNFLYMISIISVHYKIKQPTHIPFKGLHPSHPLIHIWTRKFLNLFKYNISSNLGLCIISVYEKICNTFTQRKSLVYTSHVYLVAGLQLNGLYSDIQMLPGKVVAHQTCTTLSSKTEVFDND